MWISDYMYLWRITDGQLRHTTDWQMLKTALTIIIFIDRRLGSIQQAELLLYFKDPQADWLELIVRLPGSRCARFTELSWAE